MVKFLLPRSITGNGNKLREDLRSKGYFLYDSDCIYLSGSSVLINIMILLLWSGSKGRLWHDD